MIKPIKYNKTIAKLLDKSKEDEETCDYILIVKEGYLIKIIKKTVVYEPYN